MAPSPIPEGPQGRWRGAGQRHRAPRPAGAWILLLGSLAAGAQEVEPPGGSWPPLPETSGRIVTYGIQATLDPGARTVRGRERITWRNPSAGPVAELRFHLYLNAFKNERTTFMRESRGSHRGHLVREGQWGWIDLESLRLEDGRDLLAGSEFIRPDDGNPHDETVLRAALPEPVPPGETIALDAEFVSRLPRVFARTGYKNDFYMVAQWFPKLGVYEPAGRRGRADPGWNCHQFHANSEFYADFGTYDVTLTVPSGYVVGATGVQAGPPVEAPGGRRAYRFVQEDVHDFAWTADPDFVRAVRRFSWLEERDPREERRMARILGLDGSRIPPAGTPDPEGIPEAIRLRDVEVTLLLQPEHRSQADRHFRAAFNAIRTFGYWYGRYPYSTLTVVDPPYGGRGAGGMEYPTLITAGTRLVAPERRLRPESVTIHEFGHQFWYGLVANNEFEEAWLDEGINSYSTGKVLEQAYGPDHGEIEIAGIPFVRFPLMEIPRDPRPGGSRDWPAGLAERLGRFLYLRWTGASNDSLLNAFRDLPFLTFPSEVPVPAWEGRRSRFLDSEPSRDELLRRSWEFYEGATYASNSYDKSVLMLRTLEVLLGEDAVARALRLFQHRYRFGHPASEDLVRIFGEVAGEDLHWYFDQILRGSDLLDYGIDRAVSRPVRSGAGVFGPPEGRRTVSRAEARGAAAAGEGEFEIEVVARRHGGVRIPVEIELTFEGGRLERIPWDGQYRWRRIRKDSGEPLLAARVGPPGGYPLDADWPNDSRTVVANSWPALRWWTRLVGWAQNVLFFYSGIS